MIKSFWRTASGELGTKRNQEENTEKPKGRTEENTEEPKGRTEKIRKKNNGENQKNPRKTETLRRARKNALLPRKAVSDYFVAGYDVRGTMYPIDVDGLKPNFKREKIVPQLKSLKFSPATLFLQQKQDPARDHRISPELAFPFRSGTIAKTFSSPL